jgi:hypothetical protein
MAKPKIEGRFVDWMQSFAEGNVPFPNCDGERHHYVPQFLLKRFRGGGKLYQLDKETGVCQETTPKEAAWHKDLYKVESTTGTHDGIVEAFFSLAETFGVAALEALVSNPEELSNRDRGDLAFLAAIQEQRVPGFLAEQKENLSFGAIMHSGVEMANMKGSRRKQREAREAYEALVDGSITIEAPDQEVLTMSLQMLVESCQVANALPWTILRATEGAFVCSDRPLTMYDPSPKFPFSAPGWMSSPMVESTMPVTRELCLRIGPSQRHWLSVKPTTRQVERVNLRTYGWASRYIYGRSPELLKRLHATAAADPERVPKPIKKRLVILNDPSTSNPEVTARNVARGWPRYVVHEEEDGRRVLHCYEVIESEEDARRSIAAREYGTPNRLEWGGDGPGIERVDP